MLKRLKRWFAARDERGARNELLRRCLGDSERAERLIAFELERSPQITRAEACRRAVAALRRDA